MKKQTIEQQPFRIEWHKSVKTPPEGGGIYCLWFGEKFYIGRSRTVRYRIKSHQSSLRGRLKSKKPIRGGMDLYQFVLEHLKANPHITVAYMEVLETCNTDAELVAAEQKYFDKFIWDKKCLNLGYVSHPYKEPAKVKIREHEHKIRKPKVKQLPKPPKPKKRKKVKPPVFLTTTQKLRALRKVLKRLESDNTMMLSKKK